MVKPFSSEHQYNLYWLEFWLRTNRFWLIKPKKELIRKVLGHLEQGLEGQSTG